MTYTLEELNIATINEFLRMMSQNQLKTAATVAIRIDVYDDYFINRMYPNTLYVERTNDDRWKAICVIANSDISGPFNNLYEIPENKEHLGKPSFMKKDSFEYKCLKAKVGEKKAIAERFVKYSIGFDEFWLNSSKETSLNDVYLSFYLGTFLGPVDLSKDRICISFMYKVGRRWFYIKPEEILKEENK